MKPPERHAPQVGDRVWWQRGEKPVRAVIVRVPEDSSRVLVRYVDERWCALADLVFLEHRNPITAEQEPQP